MATARQLTALLRSYAEGDEERFYTAALQLAAHEARLGHGNLARELRGLVDKARSRRAATELGGGPAAVPIVRPRGELSNLLSVSYPDARLNDMVLSGELERRLKRVLREQRQQSKLLSHGLAPRSKLLLVGPPGSGKTLTARALAGELRLPLFLIVLDALMTKFMGETAAKLRIVFDGISQTRGVYLFDEFDAIGSRRAATNDVGEIRRVLNSFLQFLEAAPPTSLIIAATNHPSLLDPALFRRFDDVIEYSHPDPELAEQLFRTRLQGFDIDDVEWREVRSQAEGSSYAEIVRGSEDAAKDAILSGKEKITTTMLMTALADRKRGRG